VKLTEGQLEFDFGNVAAEKMDLQTRRNNLEGMKLCDFLVEFPDRLLLIEVKNSEQVSGNNVAQLGTLNSTVHTNNIRKDLAPKARDTYTYLHLMDRIGSKSLDYVVFLGLNLVPMDHQTLLTAKDKLMHRLLQEDTAPWKRRYIRDCAVITEHALADGRWSFSVRRIPSSEEGTS
jgi:hypothetical protein